MKCSYVRSYPITGLDSPLGLQIEVPIIFIQSANEGDKFSVLRTGRLYPSGDIPGAHFC